MLKRLPVRRWQSRQWHIEIFNGSPSHLIAREPQWHCVVRDGISSYSEEACIHGTEKNCQCPHAGGRAECPTILPEMTLPRERPQRFSMVCSGHSRRFRDATCRA